MKKKQPDLIQMLLNDSTPISRADLLRSEVFANDQLPADKKSFSSFDVFCLLWLKKRKLENADPALLWRVYMNEWEEAIIKSYCEVKAVDDFIKFNEMRNAKLKHLKKVLEFATQSRVVLLKQMKPDELASQVERLKADYEYWLTLDFYNYFLGINS